MRAHDLQNGQRGIEIVAVVEQRLLDRFADSLEPRKVDDAGDVVVAEDLVHCRLVAAVSLDEGRTLAGDRFDAVNDLRRAVVQIIDDDNILSFAGAVSKYTAHPGTVTIRRQSTAKQ